MRRVIVTTHLSLDGVMQAPRRADEDTRGGFALGGWTTPFSDPVMARVMGEGMANSGPLLFGRRTYQDFYAVWPKRIGNPISEVLNKSQKYVASRTIEGPLPWVNSALLEGDATDAVATLKTQPGKDLVVIGSGAFARSLIRRGLVDEYVLLIYPVVLGSGQRLFTENGTVATLRLLDSVTTTTGVVIATYQAGTATQSQASDDRSSVDSSLDRRPVASSASHR